MDENAEAIGRISGSERMVYECPTCYSLVVNMAEHEFAMHVV